jgi:hypothetical protein
MKQIGLLALVLVLAGICFFGLSWKGNDARRQLRVIQGGLMIKLQSLQAIQTRKAALEMKIHDLRAAVGKTEPMMPLDKAISEIIGTNGLASMSSEMRRAFLAGLGFTWQSSDNYVLVHKAALKGVRPNLFKMGGKVAELADLACAILSIMPEERQQVDVAFANSWDEFAALAKANIQRDGPSGQMLVRFMIPGSDQIAHILTNHLFSNIAGAIGSERAELLGSFAVAGGWLPASYFAGVTNTLAVLQQPGTGGKSELLCQRSGRSEGTTKIDPQHFPPLWEKIFPGGWTEIAQREGFELPQSKQ